MAKEPVITNEYADIDDPYGCLAIDICNTLGFLDDKGDKLVSVKRVIEAFMQDSSGTAFTGQLMKENHRFRDLIFEQLAYNPANWRERAMKAIGITLEALP